MSNIASDIIIRAGIVLHDTTKVRWQETELLKWLNDAQNEVVLFRPDASVETRSIRLVGGTRQSIPTGTEDVRTANQIATDEAAIDSDTSFDTALDDAGATVTSEVANAARAAAKAALIVLIPEGTRLIDVVRNSGVSGAGNAITVVDRDVLDAQLPSWQSGTASTKVEHYVFDLRNPTSFYVYPGVQAAIEVELVYSSIPPTIETTASSLGVPSLYRNALLDYVLYRAYSKDADFAGNAQRALKHYESFTASLVMKFQADKMVDPNRQSAEVPGPA
jgi:hypothetical protein